MTIVSFSNSYICHYMKYMCTLFFFPQKDEGGAEEPLNIENTLWANTVVASGTALGVVIYTGGEGRAVMNTSQPHSKVGRV